MNLLRYLRSKYDWIIYCLFYKSFNRTFVKNPAIVYAMKLEFDRFLKDMPIPDEQKRAVEETFNRNHGIEG